MFVKKLVEKATIKKGSNSTSEGSSSRVKDSDVEPRLVYHHGIPCGSSISDYDPIQRILALSTNDGRVKLFGRDNNTEALLESKEPSPSKFLHFFYNQGFLVNVTSNNNIQVWDIDQKILCDVYAYQHEITAFTVIQQSPFMYVGDSDGNVSVLKLEKEPCRFVLTTYTILFATSHGNLTEVSSENNAVTHILPQPMAESKRALIIFEDGLIALWCIRESRVMFTTGGHLLQTLHHEAMKVTSACWACRSGTKLVLGYSNGEIFIWGIPNSNSTTTLTQNTLISKLNVGYKLNKTPVSLLKWSYGDDKASRLYTAGASNSHSDNLSQVVLLNDQTESRMIKLSLHMPEPCVDMEIVTGQQDYIILVGKSGRVYGYDDNAIEKYLIQCQSRGHSSLPKEVVVKIPFLDSSVTVSKLVTNNTCLDLPDEEYVKVAKELPCMFSLEAKINDVPNHFNGFSRVRNLYITGHASGAITFCDVSTPAFIPILAIKKQSEEDHSLSGIAITALFFDANSCLLVSGDRSGMVRIYKLKPDQYATDNGFLSFQGSSKKGQSHIVESIKLLKINGAILCMNISHGSRRLAVGSDQGYVSVIDLEGPSILYHQRIESELSTGIISLQYLSCSLLHGFEKNCIAVVTKDSSVLALDSDTGEKLNTTVIRPKKPYKALFMHILNGNDHESENGTSKQPLLLLCSEKALYLYSFTHVIQGVKKVIGKKKFQSSCCWASTFCSSSGIALILLFTTGRIEIRSLPELSMLKETFIRGFSYSTPKPNSLANTSISSSSEGDIIVVNEDQEIHVISVLSHRKLFRLLESSTQIYRKGITISQEAQVSAGPAIPKEKKKGLFSSVIKDITGNKSKPVPEPVEADDPKISFQELETIFSTAHFSAHAEVPTQNKAVDQKEVELDIDDIDIDSVAEEPNEKIKEPNMLSAINTQSQNLANKFQGLIKGKIRQMKTKSEKKATKEEEEQEEKGVAVDQIKKRYGFSASNETSAAKLAESKLQENVTKLEGINLRASQMQDTAKSFSALAKQMLRTEQNRQGS